MEKKHTGIRITIELQLLAWESMSGCVGFRAMTLSAPSPWRIMG